MAWDIFRAGVGLISVVILVYAWIILGQLTLKKLTDTDPEVKEISGCIWIFLLALFVANLSLDTFFIKVVVPWIMG